MLKRVLTAACAALFVAGCGSSRNDTGSSSGSTGTTTHTTTSGSSTSTTTTGSTGTTTAGSSSGTTTSGTTTGTTTSGTTTGSTTSGTTGSACTQEPNVGAVRSAATPINTKVCISDVVTVWASNYGSLIADGGTQYAGRYVVADSNGDAIEVYKNKASGTLSVDPTAGQTVNVQGYLEYGQYPYDGGQIDIGHKPPSLAITASTNNTAVPTPDTVASLTELTDADQTTHVGRFVIVPAGTYTQDNADPVMHIGTYQDGVGLTQNGVTIHVQTFDFKHAGSSSCYPSDGGFPDLTGGNFKAFVDLYKGGDNAVHKTLFYGNCGQ